MLSKEDSLKWMMRRIEEYCSSKSDIGEVVDDFDEVGKLGWGFSAMDELEEVNLGQEGTSRPTYVRASLTREQKEEMQEMLKEFIDCFALRYTEMSRLDKSLVEHRLPMKLGFRPYKQSVRSFSLKVIDKVKEEVDSLLKAWFIQPCRYAEWVSNIMSVEKKNMGEI
jgi:hypothetical protein